MWAEMQQMVKHPYWPSELSWKSIEEFNKCCYKYILILTHTHTGKHVTGDRAGLDSLGTFPVTALIKLDQSTHVASPRMTIKLYLIPVKGLQLNRGQNKQEV